MVGILRDKWAKDKPTSATVQMNACRVHVYGEHNGYGRVACCKLARTKPARDQWKSQCQFCNQTPHKNCSWLVADNICLNPRAKDKAPVRNIEVPKTDFPESVGMRKGY